MCIRDSLEVVGDNVVVVSGALGYHHIVDGLYLLVVEVSAGGLDVLQHRQPYRKGIHHKGCLLYTSLRALSTLTGLTIDMSIPSMTVDMLGAIMSVPITEFAQVGDKVLDVYKRQTL